MNYTLTKTNTIRTNKIKAFGLSLGIMAMSFAFFVGNPSNAQAEEDLDWICCKAINGPGCVDKGGVNWRKDIKIEGSQANCNIH